MQHCKWIWVLALAGGTSASSAYGETSPAPLAFRAEARVDVDASGKVVGVGVDDALPEAVRQFVAREVGTWSFSQRKREGQQGVASTWLALSACAVPQADGGYSLGLAYHGHGPRQKGGGPFAIPAGMGAVVAKHKMEGEITVHFVVHADGTATLESVDGLTDETRENRLLRTEIGHMVELNRFEPEQIDGKPVATHESMFLTYGRGDSGRRSYRFGWKTRYMRSPQCDTAAAAGVEPDIGVPLRAIDSVLDVEPGV